MDTAADRGASSAPEAGTPATRNGRSPRLPPRLSKAQVVTACSLIALTLHTLAVLWTWFSFKDSPGTRGWWLIYTDLPVSFLYGHTTHGSLLVWSLLLGGLQWALTGGLVALLVWHLAAARRS